ncbi:BrnA antitoxin family protein [Amphibiibacter pelophylacis]|uniref:BrnA antitoxin family protein n=1 Tax=Amphibiibacter pelophylacis TaxID=1799477 RepID=A0ACC6P0Q3_9BURK
MSKKWLTLSVGEPRPAIDWARADAAPHAGQPDDESPELTEAEAVRLRPLAQVLADSEKGRQRITISLDRTVVDQFKALAGGRGYQSLINSTLRAALSTQGGSAGSAPLETIKQALREVLQEARTPDKP